MFELCKWIHEKLEQLPLIKYPFKIQELPKNGIYFFYEIGEFWGHGGYKPRIVRIGTHKNNNFRSRINEHFLLNKKKIEFGLDNPKPSDRSIFRKNIGRALLNLTHDNYIKIWNISYIERKNKEKFRQYRDIQKEKQIEIKISEIIKKNFSFKYIIIDNEGLRIGSNGLESSLIGTVAQCYLCRASKNWLGRKSNIRKVGQGKLWQIQHLNDFAISNLDKKAILEAIKKTKDFIENS